MRIYIDTNIFLDYLLGRKDKFRDLGLIAFELFRKIIQEKHEIIISDILIKELEFNTEKDKLKGIYDWLGKANKIIKTKTEKGDKLKAIKISKKQTLPRSDCLHSILAKKEKADLIITRNIKDFPDLVETILPESL
jgi:predicted nucleic acid-binding protein